MDQTMTGAAAVFCGVWHLVHNLETIVEIDKTS